MRVTLRDAGHVERDTAEFHQYVTTNGRPEKQPQVCFERSPDLKPVHTQHTQPTYITHRQTNRQIDIERYRVRFAGGMHPCLS
ncbi:hypothetical protein QQF64_005321 [Cirrhinus molitorella]|uniref:Uncharacterized protein n=1 Tax=Cirrhinus molitorella TaxID=172907 RepID=A0ABR3MBX8_9TELE